MKQGMIGMRTLRQLLALAALAAVIAVSISCGDVVRESRASAFVLIDSLTAVPGGPTVGTGSSVLNSDVLSFITTPAPCSPAAPCPTIFADPGTVALRLAMKNALVSPSFNNEVTITRYHVSYRRADGRNTQGVDVPFAFDGAATATIPATGGVSMGFELVRAVAKAEAPLALLVNSPTILSVIADVTFYGKDRVGNDVSVSGSMTIEFANYGG
jgi:hypothetical protein